MNIYSNYIIMNIYIYKIYVQFNFTVQFNLTIQSKSSVQFSSTIATSFGTPRQRAGARWRLPELSSVLRIEFN